MQKMPIIGISANFQDDNSMLARQYYESVILAGGAPLIIPLITDNEVLTQIVRSLDGLIMSGGADICPEYFGEKPIAELGEVIPQRDEYDLKLLEIAHAHQVPILGICRGMQAMNVVFCGSLYQDIKAQYDGFTLEHNQSEPKNEPTHDVFIKDNSQLAQIVGAESLAVNTVHHQAVRRTAAGFDASAFAEDGVCEAIESAYYSEMGVQWHPEHLVEQRAKSKEPRQENPHLKILKWLIDEAKIFHRAKNIHKKYPTIDSHCDTPMYFDYGVDICKDNAGIIVNLKDLGEAEADEFVPYRTKVDVPKMQRGLLDAVFMVAYIPQKEVKAGEKAEFLLKKIISQVLQNADIAGIAASESDLRKLKSEGKKAIFLGIENGNALGECLENIDKFYKLGVRYITLCHNGDNQICDSAQKSQQTHGGLSEFGKKVVEKMNELGIMIDISHAAESTFYDILKLSKKSIIASHSCTAALHNHPRNLTDEQIVALAKNGGVCQICLYKNFLTSLPAASVETAVAHINHVVKLVGIDYVGIGSDFDGGGEILGCLAENEIISITKALIRHGYTDEEIGKILGGNFLRVMRDNL